MQKIFMTTALGLSVLSCAHIKPVNRAYPETSLKSATPPTHNLQPKSKANGHVKYPITQLEKKPIFKKSENDFLEKRPSKKVDFWIKYFAVQNKDRLERFVANGEKYRKIVEETFERYGLPKELFFVGIIESGYYNASKSHAGAVGPWQFMPATARRYGLRVSRSLDERQNIFKATEAAALYFQDLYNIFGSWELALAAYNKGENGIIRRIRGANTRDFYELSAKGVIPKETRHYVPKVLAVMEILNNKDKYNIQTKKWVDNPFEDVVTMEIDRSVSVAALASKLRISSDLVRKLNPDIKQAHIPHPGRKKLEIYLPKDSQKAMKSFKRYMASLSTHSKSHTKKSEHIEYHRVRKNESLYSIAKRYDTNIKDLKALNNLRRNTIFVGQRIKVKTESQSKVLYSYIVKQGDNLSKIARLFNTKSSHLKKLNRKNNSKILVGEKLQVPPHKIKIHKVSAGDYLGKIAKVNNKTLSEILELNGGVKRIYPGQEIIVDIEKI